jgi:Tol biopolymer transport system component
MIFDKKKREIIKLIKNGEFSRALSLLKEVVNREPSNIEMRIELARLYFKSEDLPNTQATLKGCLSYRLSKEDVNKILEITNRYRLVSDKYFNFDLDFSPEGDKIVYVSVRRDTDGDGKFTMNDCGGIYIYDLKKHLETQIVSDSYYNSSPKFSPDGKRVVYLSARVDSDGDGRITSRDSANIYIFDLERGEEKVFFLSGWRAKHPSLHRDNKKILYCGWKPGKVTSHVYIFDIESNLTYEIGHERYDHTFPNFSPDGNSVVYSSWRLDTNGDGKIDIRDNSGIYLYNLTTKEERQLVSEKYDNRFPTFSFDGKYVVYLSRRRDTNRDGVINSFDNPGIWVIDVRSGKEQCVVSDEFYNGFPTFLYDNKRIVYTGSWRREKDEDEEVRDYFEHKGIYCKGVNERSEIQIVNEKYYSCREIVSSPVDSKIAYIASRNKYRGIYIADVDNLPDNDMLYKIIENNLSE